MKKIASALLILLIFGALIFVGALFLKQTDTFMEGIASVPSPTEKDIPEKSTKCEPITITQTDGTRNLIQRS